MGKDGYIYIIHEHARRMAPVWLAALIGTACILLVGEQITSSMFWAVFALVHYGALCWVILKYYPAAFVLLLWFAFIRLTTMISGVAIESGGYMPEFLLIGEPHGGFLRLEILYVTGMGFAAILVTSLIKSLKLNHLEHPQFFAVYSWGLPVLGIVMLLCAGALWIGLQHGFPMLTGIDRFVYWQQVDSQFLSFFLDNRSLFAVFLGLLFSICCVRPPTSLNYQAFMKFMAMLIFTLMLAISLLFAEKFTSIALMLISFAVPLFLLNGDMLKDLSAKLIPLGLLIAIITMPAVFSVYGVSENPDAAFQRLQAKTASQAQLWYIQDRKERDLFSLDEARLRHNAKAVLSDNPENVARVPPFLGVRDFMAAYLPRDRYKHYIERGVTLTMATEAYLLKMFGYIGMVPAYMILLGVYGMYLVYFAYALYSLNPIRLLLAAKLLVWTNFGLNQGYFYLLLGFKPFALLAVIIAFEMGMAVVAGRKTEDGGVVK